MLCCTVILGGSTVCNRIVPCCAVYLLLLTSAQGTAVLCSRICFTHYFAPCRTVFVGVALGVAQCFALCATAHCSAHWALGPVYCTAQCSAEPWAVGPCSTAVLSNMQC